ncbi:hypothetical protein SAV14893_080500 [Streptomyces avermitilis]|uniref:Uncharacterized protein n=1 Tax=Streptomyces avermitilis TaxID=33903 RepID=A0A4D4MHI3_STRAX|nr:hypothetical protein SAV14893_080500 [Streptomyces avermitilis]GDY70969.1 hypothetical protein SAV31267_004540 [Streptomyces avermitilis]
MPVGYHRPRLGRLPQARHPAHGIVRSSGPHRKPHGTRGTGSGKRPTGSVASGEYRLLRVTDSPEATNLS